MLVDTAILQQTAFNNIEFITIASTGDATDFGDLTNNSKAGATLSNSTRGIHFIGQSYPAYTNIINYVTIASTGNANDFGDLQQITTNPQQLLTALVDYIFQE